MATKKQIRSNRKNSQKSTGPNSPEGKQITSKNSTKYGLHAKDVVINTPDLPENESEYLTLVESLKIELRPTSLFQESLVIKIANCLWRSQRAIRAETAQITRQLDYIEPACYIEPVISFSKRDNMFEEPIELDKDEVDRERSNLVKLKSIPNEEFSMNLLRYEMRLDRQLSRAYTLLRHLQLMEVTNSIEDQHLEIEKTENEPNSPEPDET